MAVRVVLRGPAGDGLAVRLAEAVGHGRGEAHGEAVAGRVAHERVAVAGAELREAHGHCVGHLEEPVPLENSQKTGTSVVGHPQLLGGPEGSHAEARVGRRHAVLADHVEALHQVREDVGAAHPLV